MPFSAGTRGKPAPKPLKRIEKFKAKLTLHDLGCIGIHLARMELRLAAAYFFKSFPSVIMSGKEGMTEADMQPKTFFLLVPKGHRCIVEN